MKLMTRILTLSLILSSPLQAHDGPHDDVEYIPPYVETQQKGTAAFKITEVGKNYIITFSSPQSNFLSSDMEKLSIAEAKKRSALLEDLKSSGSLFNAEDFKCRDLISSSQKKPKHRVGEPGLDKKLKGKKKAELNKYIQPFVEFSAYYKIRCKSPIVESQVKHRLFELAPNLNRIHWRFTAGKIKKDEFVKRSLQKKSTATSVVKVKKAPVGPKSQGEKSKAKSPKIGSKKEKKNETPK